MSKPKQCPVGIHVGKVEGKNLSEPRAFIGFGDLLYDTVTTPLTRARMHCLSNLREEDVRWLIDALRLELRTTFRKRKRPAT